MGYLNKYFNTEHDEQLLDLLRFYNKILAALSKSNMRGLP
jgi:hypothetical protein